jgi:hypothetical protein
VSLCIEGIPYHAHQPSTNRHLLTQGTLLKIIDHHHYNVNDAQCCCIIVWARTPDTIAKEVGFWLEEISDRPSVAWHFTNFNEASQPHTCHVRVLNYEAIIHIDQIIDYRPPTGHPQTSLSNIRSDGSLASTMTGHCCHRTDPSRSASPPPPTSVIGPHQAMVGRMALATAPATLASSVPAATAEDAKTWQSKFVVIIADMTQHRSGHVRLPLAGRPLPS